jgi:pimeloyl-ACP methyl ester carboxylesterase
VSVVTGEGKDSADAEWLAAGQRWAWMTRLSEPGMVGGGAAVTTERRTRPSRRGPGMTQAILAVAVVALAAACGGGRGGRTGTTAAPPSPASRRPGTTVAAISKPCLSAAEQERTFRFRTGSGTTLVGLALGRGRSGLVLGHQLGGDLCEWLPQARAFARRGYQALAFDFAGFGHSQHGSAHDRVDTDVVAAAEQLRRRGADRIVLVGSSMGGTAVLSAATRIRPPVAGVVSLSGPSGFGGVDARAAMRRLLVPVLLVVGADDRTFNTQARTLYAAARFRDKRLLVVPGRVHGTGMLELGDQAPKVLAAVRGFIDDRTGH